MNQLKFGILLNYVSIIVTFGVGLIYTPFLIHILGQTDYGIYALAVAIAGYLSLLDLGIGNSIVRYIAQNQAIGTKEKETKLIGYFFKFFCCIAIATFVIGLLISWNLHSYISDEFSSEQIETLQWMIFILTINFAIGFVLNTFSAVLQAYQRFIYLKLMNIIRQIVTPILSVISLIYFQNVIILTLILATVNITVLLINYVYYKKQLRIKMSFLKIDSSFKKEILGYSIVIFIVAIADALYWQTDQVLLGILKDPETVAIYAVAIQFIFIFQSLSTAVNGVFLPHLTHIVSEENHMSKLNTLYINVSKFQTFIIGLFFSGFILVGENFITLWVGEEFSTVYLLILILMSTFSLDLIQNLGLTIMQAKGKYKFRAYVLIICSIINIIISIPTIKMYGSIGTAIVTAIFIFIGNVFILNLYFHKALQLNMILYWKVISKFLILIALITLVVFNIKSLFVIDRWITLILFAIAYSLIYSLIIFFMYLSKEEQRWILKKILK